jgi:hypothetical protein
MTYHPAENRNQPLNQPHDSDEHPIVINAKRAKSARRGLPILYVLIASSALIVIAFLVIFFVFHHAVR